MVFQNYALFPHMSVAENIAFPLKMRRVPRAEIQSRVVDALQLVKLSGYDDRLPRQLSGGQQQRVALARAVVFGPRCSCSTSRSVRSTASCASRCSSRSSGCSAASA